MTWHPISREEALNAGWNRDSSLGSTGLSSAVTRAYDEWFGIEKEQRVYLDLTLRWMTERFDAEMDIVTASPPTEGGPAQIDIFYDRVGGLMPGDYEWMTLAAVLRDSVTAYEVYLGTAIDEVLGTNQKRRTKNDLTPSWKELEVLYAHLNLTPKPAAVSEIVALRNILTHKRGELRTEDDRRKFGKAGAVFEQRIAHLTEERLLGYLDILSDHVHQIDPVLWAYSWGNHRVPEWDPKSQMNLDEL